MGATTTPTAEQATTLIDQIIDQQQVLAAAQAKQAALMLAFSDIRRRLDQHRITTMRHDGADPRYNAGEFAALEIGLATKTNKHTIARTIGIARRLKDETPDAWDAWQAGHIDQQRAAHINKALLRLTRDSSKQLLNALVVDVAICKTPELLSRWLNEFIARVEPDQTNDRLRRSLEDRYISIRPDLDGISFLNAAIASADADAINQVLNALADIVLPGDTRTLQQRRADACTDLLLGKISNGCHVRWENDPDIHDENDADADEENHGYADIHEGGCDHSEPDDESADHARGGAGHRVDDPADHKEPDTADPTESSDRAGNTSTDDNVPAVTDSDHATMGEDDPEFGQRCGPEDNKSNDTDITITPADVGGRPWDTDDDFDLPATAFRPDPHQPGPEPDPGDPLPPESPPTGNASPPNPYRKGRPVITPCPHDHHTKPIPATIGVIISAQSLFGYSNTPGQLTDRSTLIPADLIRDLAQQSGTLFHRLLTDEQGNLLDVTELGRFPSRKLGIAINYRDGTCTTPICATPAHKCDHDHVIPVPEGPTTAENLQNHCRPEHRAKTHAGHHTTRTGNATTWTTPTGHKYETTDQPFPIEQWPTEKPTELSDE